MDSFSKTALSELDYAISVSKSFQRRIHFVFPSLDSDYIECENALRALKYSYRHYCMVHVPNNLDEKYISIIKNLKLWIAETDTTFDFERSDLLGDHIYINCKDTCIDILHDNLYKITPMCEYKYDSADGVIYQNEISLPKRQKRR